MTSKLYFTPGACSLFPNIVAHEAGIPIELTKVDLASHTLENGTDYYTINPKGYIPALSLEEGGVLAEASVIANYLASKKPEAKLLPTSGTMEYFRTLELVAFTSTELHKTISQLWNPAHSEATRKIFIDRALTRFATLEEQLGNNEYFINGKYTIADPYIFVMLNWTKLHNIDMSAFPKLQAFGERMMARPATIAAMKAEGLIA